MALRSSLIHPNPVLTAASAILDNSRRQSKGDSKPPTCDGPASDGLGGALPLLTASRFVVSDDAVVSGRVPKTRWMTRLPSHKAKQVKLGSPVVESRPRRPSVPRCPANWRLTAPEVERSRRLFHDR